MNIKGSEGVIFKSRNRGWRALRLQIGKKVCEYNTMVREGCILSRNIADEPFIVGEEVFKDVPISGRSVYKLM